MTEAGFIKDLKCGGSRGAGSLLVLLNRFHRGLMNAYVCFV